MAQLKTNLKRWICEEFSADMTTLLTYEACSSVLFTDEEGNKKEVVVLLDHQVVQILERYLSSAGCAGAQNMANHVMRILTSDASEYWTRASPIDQHCMRDSDSGTYMAVPQLLLSRKTKRALKNDESLQKFYGDGGLLVDWSESGRYQYLFKDFNPRSMSSSDVQEMPWVFIMCREMTSEDEDSYDNELARKYCNLSTPKGKGRPVKRDRGVSTPQQKPEKAPKKQKVTTKPKKKKKTPLRELGGRDPLWEGSVHPPRGATHDPPSKTLDMLNEELPHQVTTQPLLARIAALEAELDDAKRKQKAPAPAAREQEALRAELQTAREQANTLRKEHEEEMSAVKKKHEEAMAAAREELKKKHEELKDTQQQVDTLTKSHEEVAASVRERLTKTHEAELASRLEKLDDEHEEKMEKLSKKKDAEMEETQKDLEKKIQKLERKNEVLQKKHDEDMEKLRNEHNRSMEDLEEKRDDLEEKLQTAQQELQTARQELQTAQQELQTAQQELQTAQQELETARQELQTARESRPPSGHNPNCDRNPTRVERTTRRSSRSDDQLVLLDDPDKFARALKKKKGRKQDAEGGGDAASQENADKSDDEEKKALKKKDTQGGGGAADQQEDEEEEDDDKAGNEEGEASMESG